MVYSVNILTNTYNIFGIQSQTDIYVPTEVSTDLKKNTVSSTILYEDFFLRFVLRPDHKTFYIFFGGGFYDAFRMLHRVGINSIFVTDR